MQPIRIVIDGRFREYSREDALKVIWRHTKKTNRRANGTRAIALYIPSRGICWVPLDALNERQIICKLENAIKSAWGEIEKDWQKVDTP